MRKIFIWITAAFLLSGVNSGAAEKGLTIKGMRSSSYAAFTRIVFEVEVAGPYVLTRSEDGKSLRLGSYEGPLVVKSALTSVRDSVVSGVETREEGGRMFVVIRLDAAAGGAKDFTLRGPDRIVIDIAKASAASAPAVAPDRVAVIVLDPGHGGKDTGLVSGQGIEKTFALELALAVRNLLKKNERLHVVLTREKDQALSLDDRAAFANSAAASVFVSIHAEADATGRVFIQDVADDSGGAAHPASGDFLGFEAGSEEQETIWGKQQAGHAQKSGALGRTIARQLAGSTADPLQAPLAALKAVDAAAVVVEIGMTQDREQAAAKLAQGIEQYVIDNR